MIHQTKLGPASSCLSCTSDFWTQNPGTHWDHTQFSELAASAESTWCFRPGHHMTSAHEALPLQISLCQLPLQDTKSQGLVGFPHSSLTLPSLPSLPSPGTISLSSPFFSLGPQSDWPTPQCHFNLITSLSLIPKHSHRL